MCLKTLTLKSEELKNNPLADSNVRKIPIIVPQDQSKPLPVIFYLSGYSSNGAKFFNFNSFEENAAANLLKMIKKNEAAKAIYVFVDAWTYWGGSQFINSFGSGNYENYIIQELVTEVKSQFLCDDNPKNWFVTGGSSGGYGALHLATSFPQIFGNVAAVAPDCFFQMSLLPEIYSVFPYIHSWGGIAYAKKELEDGRLLKRRESHKILNVIAMGHCYGTNQKGEIQWPINIEGELLQSVWQHWLKYDPLKFIPLRNENVEKLNNIYLDVGVFDQFNLQFGTRQLFKLLKEITNNVVLTEYKGSHFDLSSRREPVWSWINNVITQS